MRYRFTTLVAGASAIALLSVTGCTAAEPVDLRTHELLAGMPEYLAGDNVYSAAGPEMFSAHVRDHLPVVYVAAYHSDEVYVLDQASFEVVDVFDSGPGPRHTVPGYDLSTLYVAGSGPDGGLTVVDPRTAEPTAAVAVPEVGNLYFTPDGSYAVVVPASYEGSAGHAGLDFYHPRSWELAGSLALPECRGVAHLDYSADGRTMLVSCADSGRIVLLDTETLDLTGEYALAAELDLDRSAQSLPQDVRLAPDGSTFLVADAAAGGVHRIDGHGGGPLEFIPTGAGAHAIYFSRDAAHAYVVNRTAGSVTVLDLETLQPVAEWVVPQARLDQGGLNADGSVLWLGGGAEDEVYAIDTVDGALLARIPVGPGPYSVTVWPQPGRYSLGNTGNLR